MLPNTESGVRRNTDAEINRRIDQSIAASIRLHADHPERIWMRLRELDAEWDIERTLEAKAAVLMFGGVMLGLTRHRAWLLLPAIVSGFLFQHAIQGWCPPLPILRRLGLRTAREIDIERYALKALRGDFGPLGPATDDDDTRAGHALQAARL